MAVTRHRSVEDMPGPPRAASALQGLAAACASSALSRGFGHTSRAPRGVRRFRSVEEADAHRQEWESHSQLFRLADLATEVRASSDERGQLRLVFEFLRSASEDGHPLRQLIAVAPEPTDDPRYDALLAAVAEDLCVRAGIPPPRWVSDSGRFLDGFWWVSELPSARARALVHAPASYRRRGVMLDRHDLSAA